MRGWLTRVLCAAVLGYAAHASAELYQWTDENGRVRITDDISRVPPEQRPGAKRELDRPSRNWNNVTIQSPAYRAPARGAAPNALGGAGGRRHVLYVKRAGREIRVPVHLNERVEWSYVVDTGASLNTIPRKAVDKLGITIDATTPRTRVAGIGGVGMEVPIVTLRSVRIGTATVENVEMAVLDTMHTGLLGMPFFNHFRVGLDPSRGTLTLEELDLSGVEGIYGGLDQGAWRTQFRQIRSQLEWVRAELRRMPKENIAQVADLEEREKYWEDQLRRLEIKATRAGVPRAWRK